MQEQSYRTMKRVRQKNMRVMNQLDCQCRLLDNERKVGLCLCNLIVQSVQAYWLYLDKVWLEYTKLFTLTLIRKVLNVKIS